MADGMKEVVTKSTTCKGMSNSDATPMHALENI
jgi:hypothetical protein